MPPTSSPAFARVAILGMAWRSFTHFSAKLLIFVSTVILARLLTTDDFGVVGFAVTTIVFLDVLSVGTGPALVYYPEDDRTSTTAFWLGQAIGIGIFALTWALAPITAAFFRDDRVLPIMRVLALTFPLQALGDTHAAILQKRLAFDRIFIPEIMLAIVKGLVSIVLALFGYGAWSLIWGQIIGSLAQSITYWIITAWRPSSIRFDLDIARSVLNYGGKYISANTISMLVLNLDYLLVGRYLGTEALGVYTLAFRIPDLMVMQFASILSKVLFPIYAQMRDVPGSLARGFFKTTRYVSLITVPLGLGLALIARPMVTVIFTDKWLAAIPVMQAIAVYVVLRSFAYNAGSAYKAEGRPQVITWMEIVRLAVLFPALWWAVTYPKSIVAVGWMQVVVGFLACIFDLNIASRLLKLPMRELGVALRPAIISGIIMCVAVQSVLYASASKADWLQLILAISVGGITYIASLWFTQNDVVLEARELLLGSLRKVTP